MGTENLSLAFYDYPDMIHDMVEHWAELLARQIERLPEDIVIDQIYWWEDMAYNHGPLVGPKTFRSFLQPGYHRVMQAAKKRGCAISAVDCSGDPHDIVRNWIEEGVNIMLPMEVTGAVDPYAWRNEFGREVRFAGGIAKSRWSSAARPLTRNWSG
jgi:uroporphyrinogen decarboxylase